MTINYSLYDPSGNITALVSGSYNAAERIKIADEIMKNEPSCEQVGFVSYGKNANLAELTMAGGEFCGNASMCAAIELFTALYAYCCSGFLKVKCSGNGDILDVSVKASEGRSFIAELHLNSTEPAEGIRHRIIEDTCVPDKADAESEIRALPGNDAKGFMYLNGNRLTPLVYVPESGTLFWENSCASGCIAVASYLYKKNGPFKDKNINMPGGSIYISANETGITLKEEITLCRKCTSELNFL